MHRLMHLNNIYSLPAGGELKRNHEKLTNFMQSNLEGDIKRSITASKERDLRPRGS